MIAQEIHSAQLTGKHKSILKALLYFDIFRYPLTKEEIHCYCSTPFEETGESIIADLVNQKLIFKHDEFYSLWADDTNAVRRKKGNALARKRIHSARRFSTIISYFPFVRAVMLSGSISKGYMEASSDIDYFIITSPGRLWIARTMMVVFRRLFLFNSRKSFCTNYFIDEQNLEIIEKNIFTAVEITSLKPMYGKALCHKFQSVNDWCNQYFPNRTIQNGLSAEKEIRIKSLLEGILNSPLLNRLDHYLMNKTIQRWTRVYGHRLKEHDFQIAFQSTPGVSRSHPEFYQKKVLQQFAEKMDDFEHRHNVQLL